MAGVSNASSRDGENINLNIIILTGEQRKHAEGSEDFTLLCHALQFSFKSIAYYIRRASLIGLNGLSGSSQHNRR
jgi:hypothetical protein